MSFSTPLFFDPRSGERVTYESLWAELSAEELDHAPFLRPSTPGEAVVAMAKALLLGQPLTLFDADFSPDELGALGGADHVLGQRLRVRGVDAPTLADALARCRRPNGFRLTLFTSGSTGVPKKVTHALESLTRTLRVDEKHSRSRWGLAYSPTHIAGVQVILQALFNGSSLIYLFQADRSAILKEIVEQGITHLSATPSFYRLLLPVEQPLTGVRAVALGGERSDATLLGRLGELFPRARLRNLYASTEAGTLLVAEDDIFAIADGLADRIRIVDKQLEVHRSLLGEVEAGLTVDEWYRTGDVVEVVSDSPLRFRILSRDRDWVNVGGHKVNPGEVEVALLGCPGVREARVYGRPNSVVGYLLCAEVVADEGFSEAAARAWLAERLQPAKIPRLIKVVAEIPRTRTGKILRA